LGFFVIKGANQGVKEMRWVRDYTPQQQDGVLYRRAILVTLGGNILLAVGKGLVAWMTHSAAIYADAANSVSDVVYSLLMALGLYLAIQPPDLGHPQGHSRFEPLVGLIVTISMCFAGFEAARNSYVRFQSGGSAIALDLPMFVLLASAAIKAGMFWIISRIAKQLRSPSLKATATDNLSDVLTSVAAFLGVLLSGLVSPLADPIAGFLVAAWIFKQAFMVGKENLGYLMGSGASMDEVKKYVQAVEEIPGILGVHHIMTEYAGPKLVIDLHVNVNGETKLNEVHAITDAVADRLKQFPEVDRVYVHVEPDGWID
jgi:cation diffusion facilitator family transporter